MEFSDFDLFKVTTDFGLREVLDRDLFAGVPPLEPSDELRRWLDQFSLLALGFGSELARIVTCSGRFSPKSCGASRRPFSSSPAFRSTWTRTAG